MSFDFEGVGICLFPIASCSCLERLDTLTVFDGPSAQFPVIALLCDEATQLEVLSTGSDLYVQLQALSQWPGQGFQARFHFQNDTAVSAGNTSTFVVNEQWMTSL